jgi:LysR family glycine cleavage system transcriptional activator
MRRLPPLSYLQAFEAAARHKSFSEAARELNCTQAAISQRIRGLEAIFGRALFLRLPNGVQTTEAAEVYLGGIGEALDQLASITRGLAGVRPAKTVSVSVPVTFAALWLSSRVKLFLDENPSIDVRLNCTIWNDPNSETSDFEIRLLGRDNPVANSLPLTADQAHVVCAPGLLTDHQGPRPGSYFPQQPLIVLIAKYDYWELWRKFNRATIGNGRQIEVDTGIAAIELARHGQGIGLALGTYIRPYLEEGSLVRPFYEGVDLNLGHYVLRPNDRPLSKPAEMFFDFLVEQGRKELEEVAPGYARPPHRTWPQPAQNANGDRVFATPTPKARYMKARKPRSSSS